MKKNEVVFMGKGSPSEVRAYSHILEELVKKGFESKNIFTQQECRTILPIAIELGGELPENIVRISETQYYLIEAKNERKKINKAVSEAKEYADKINRSNLVKCYFITGIAGNDDEGYFAKSMFYKNGKWENITENRTELTRLLSNAQIFKIRDTKDPDLKDIEISDQEFLKAAEDINEYLHEGGTNKDLRAKYISAILLALADSSDLNLDAEPYELIATINTRVELLLKKHKKSDFASFIKIDLPSSTDNHNRFKTSIVKTIQVLLDLNIRSAMKSGNDLLGKFYEVFLKYGNGAKEIGIVLTPRHITKFVAEVLDIQANDLVYDLTCGTGGFLVAAFDEVRKKTTSKEFEKFKKFGLYRIEQQDPVVALALVNMIFRGDGKTNIIEGDCFAKWLNAKTVEGEIVAEFVSKDSSSRIPPITKVLMNPPFPNQTACGHPNLKDGVC
jgi:type I restriction enzyme M protein